MTKSQSLVFKSNTVYDIRLLFFESKTGSPSVLFFFALLLCVAKLSACSMSSGFLTSVKLTSTCGSSDFGQQKHKTVNRNDGCDLRTSIPSACFIRTEPVMWLLPEKPPASG